MLSITNKYEMSDEVFNRISQIVRTTCGINLHHGKKELVKARLNRRLRELQMKDFQQYLDYLEGENKPEEIILMLDVLSTNVTEFFRQAEQFEYLRANYLRQKFAAAGGTPLKLRIWSAGCSTGEEPYSLAMLLTECTPLGREIDFQILATDLSTRVLAQARQGVYAPEDVQALKPYWVKKYFSSGGDHRGTAFTIKPEIRKMVAFARLNLTDPWPMHGPFDIVFCRNVMIYFEADIRQRLINRFWNLLASDGLLAVGQAEGFSGLNSEFKYLGDSLYAKKEQWGRK